MKITTAEQLYDLPEMSAIRDTRGATGVTYSGFVWYPDTRPMSCEWVANRYLPATLLVPAEIEEVEE